MRNTFASLFVLTSAFVAAPAAAGGFSTARFGGEHGNPTTDNPSAIYYNPGAIPATDGIQIMADGSIAFRWASYSHAQNTALPDTVEVPEPPNGVGANYGEANLFNVRAAPMLGATASIPVADGYNIGAGLGFFVPFGGSAEWTKNEAFEGNTSYPGAVDGVQRWYTITGQLQSIYISGAIGVRLADIVHIGVSGGVSLDTINTLRARAASGNNPIGRLEGRAWLDASAVHPQLGGGVLITPLEDREQLKIGLSYQAPPGFMNTNVEGKLVKQLSGTIAGDLPGEEVEVHQNYPDVWRLGASFRPMSEMELRLFGDYTRWSLFSEQCIANVGQECKVSGSFDGPPDQYGAPAEGIPPPQVNLPRNWNDTFGIRFGLSYWVIPDIEIFGGIGYDSNAVPDTNLDPALTDFHDISAALGAKIRFVEQFAAALSYTHLFYISRDTTGESNNALYQGPSNAPDSGGEYTQTIGVVNINLIASFDPFVQTKAEATTK
jgi:long-chain fatty acid transport protein